jgi:hypothetical protein
MLESRQRLLFWEKGVRFFQKILKSSFRLLFRGETANKIIKINFPLKYFTMMPKDKTGYRGKEDANETNRKTLTFSLFPLAAPSPLWRQ